MSYRIIVYYKMFGSTNIEKKSYYPVTECSTIGNVDWSIVKPNRSGVIFYFLDKGKLKFIMGIDAPSNDITDFAGGVKYKTDDENAVIGGLREMVEESLGVFGELTQESINNHIVTYSDNMMIMFIGIKIDKDNVEKNFLERVSNKPNPELTNICFLDVDQLNYFLYKQSKNSEHIMYNKVKRHLLSNMSFLERIINKPSNKQIGI